MASPCPNLADAAATLQKCLELGDAAFIAGTQRQLHLRI